MQMRFDRLCFNMRQQGDVVLFMSVCLKVWTNVPIPPCCLKSSIIWFQIHLKQSQI